jgi:UDPglucose 6-dehydrogenase
MRISVIGAGYVGLTTAACLAEIGHEVFCAESNAQKLNLLEQGRLPFYEPYLAKVVENNRRSQRLQFGSAEAAVDQGHAIFICVGTPPLENGEADLSAIERVARTIVQRAHGYRLVVEKSTVPVQTARQLRKHLSLYNTNHLDYDVASNPEFLREGSALEDFFHPDRIVIGVESSRAAEQLQEIYRPVLDQTFACPVHTACPSRQKPALVEMDTNSAEIVKHASNSFLAMKISFINLIADLCEVAGADISKVAEGIGSDRRIGQSFLRPGIGFGGFCFPKDLQAFVRIAEKLGCEFSLLKEVERINHGRIDRFVEMVRRELWILQGKRIAVWGLAFKPNTDDVRFAPSISIIKRLLAEGAEIQAYDPQAIESAKAQLADVHYYHDMYEAARGADAILILTEWDEFLGADWGRLRSLVERPLVIDGRNMFDREHMLSQGFEYVDIGRVPVGSTSSLAYTNAAPALETSSKRPPSASLGQVTQ